MCFDHSKLPTKLVRCTCAACITIDDPEMVHWVKEIDWEKAREMFDARIQENQQRTETSKEA